MILVPQSVAPAKYRSIGRSARADTKAVEAWKNRTDASNVVVAVIDGGVDVDHPDLDDNLWINKKRNQIMELMIKWLYR